MTRTEAAILSEAIMLLTPYAAGYDRMDAGDRYAYEVLVTEVSGQTASSATSEWNLRTFGGVCALIAEAIGDTALAHLSSAPLARSEAALLAEAIMLLTPYRAYVSLPEFGETATSAWLYRIIVERTTPIYPHLITTTVRSLDDAPHVAHFLATHAEGKDAFR